MDTIKCYDKYVNAMYSDSDGLSIPEVQYRFTLKYSEARECVLYAQSRGWVTPEKTGDRYTFVRKGLAMRELPEADCRYIAGRISLYAVKILSHLLKKRKATLAQLVKDLEEDEDEIFEGLSDLLQHEFVITFDDTYYVNLSEKGITTIADERKKLIERARNNRNPFDF